MMLIKTRLRSSLNDKSLSHLMKIAIESPAELTDSHLEEVVDVWNRKNRRIAVYSRRQKKVPPFYPYNERARLKKRAANGN